MTVGSDSDRKVTVESDSDSFGVLVTGVLVIGNLWRVIGF